MNRQPTEISAAEQAYLLAIRQSRGGEPLSAADLARRMRVSPRKGLTGSLLGTGIPYRDMTHADAYFGMMRDLIVDSAGVRRPGSAALDFAWLAMGRIDGFWELGLAPWDFAAGALLVREAGGIVTDLGGGSRYLDTGNVVAAGPRLHKVMLDTIQPHLSASLRE